MHPCRRCSRHARDILQAKAVACIGVFEWWEDHLLSIRCRSRWLSTRSGWASSLCRSAQFQSPGWRTRSSLWLYRRRLADTSWAQTNSWLGCYQSGHHTPALPLSSKNWTLSCWSATGKLWRWSRGLSSVTSFVQAISRSQIWASLAHQSRLAPRIFDIRQPSAWNWSLCFMTDSSSDLPVLRGSLDLEAYLWWLTYLRCPWASHYRCQRAQAFLLAFGSTLALSQILAYRRYVTHARAVSRLGRRSPWSSSIPAACLLLHPLKQTYPAHADRMHSNLCPLSTCLFYSCLLAALEAASARACDPPDQLCTLRRGRRGAPMS